MSKSRIQTGIVGVEGMYTAHLTDTSQQILGCSIKYN